LKVNVIDGHSKYFGDHPFWFYILAHLPAIFNILYPFCLYGVYFYMKETLNKNKSPEIMYMTVFYVLIFSIIAHKEKRFMLPILAFVFLVLGYLLARKARSWGKGII
jgi:phosphatidylinositol glycan class B